MSARIYPFPCPEDQEVINAAIEVFLTVPSEMSRERMLKTIRMILDRYGISKFSFADYTVQATRMPGYSVIWAKKSVTGHTCPKCGEKLYGPYSRIKILSVLERRNHHIVTYGCRCGKVFAKQENC